VEAKTLEKPLQGQVGFGKKSQKQFLQRGRKGWEK
jgi:hypothetical protein